MYIGNESTACYVLPPYKALIACLIPIIEKKQFDSGASRATLFILRLHKDVEDSNTVGACKLRKQDAKDIIRTATALAWNMATRGGDGHVGARRD